MSSFPRVYWAAGTKKFTHSFVSGFQTWLEFLNGFVISCHDSLTSIMSFSSCVVTLPAWPGRPSWPAGRRWPAEPSKAQSILRNPLCSQGLFSLSGDLNTRKITQQNCTIPLSPSLPQVPRSADYQKKKKSQNWNDLCKTPGNFFQEFLKSLCQGATEELRNDNSKLYPKGSVGTSEGGTRNEMVMTRDTT